MHFCSYLATVRRVNQVLGNYEKEIVTTVMKTVKSLPEKTLNQHVQQPTTATTCVNIQNKKSEHL